jgi:hypothetical protein
MVPAILWVACGSTGCMGKKFQENIRKILGFSVLDCLPSVNVSTKKGGGCTKHP